MERKTNKRIEKKTILIFSPQVFIDGRRGLMRNHSGFALIIGTLLGGLSDGYSYFFLTNGFVKRDFRYNNVTVLKHSVSQLILGSLLSWPIGVFFFFKYSGSMLDRIHFFFYGLNYFLFEKALRKIKPDLVNVHGVYIETSCLEDLAIKKGIPCVISLHGIINNEYVNCRLWQKKLEGDMAGKAISNGGVITALSHGARNFIENKYAISEDKVFLCLNDSDILSIKSEPIKLKNNEENKCILCYIGSVSYCKNQLLLLDALSALDPSASRSFFVYFAGAPSDDFSIVEEIEKRSLSDVCFYLGSRSKEEIKFLIQHSDINVLLSNSEGFGLSILEAALLGKTSIISSYCDSVEDLNFGNQQYIVNPNVEEVKKCLNNIASSPKRLIQNSLAEQASKLKFPAMAKSFENVFGLFLHDKKD